MRAPLAQAAWPGPPVAGPVRAVDGLPQSVNLAFSGDQIGFVWRIPDKFAVTQINQLQHPGDDATGPPQRHSVELHLEQGPSLVFLTRRGARLVVDDPKLAGPGYVKPVDIAAEGQS